jgi:hypothetical protein
MRMARMGKKGKRMNKRGKLPVSQCIQNVSRGWKEEFEADFLIFYSFQE